MNKYLCLIILLFPTISIAEEKDVIFAQGGELKLALYPNNLKHLGLEIVWDQQASFNVSGLIEHTLPIDAKTPLRLLTQKGKYLGIESGGLFIPGPLIIRYQNREKILSGLRVQKSEQLYRLNFTDDSGQIWFEGEHFHYYFEPERKQLIFNAMGINSGSALEHWLGADESSNFFLGHAEIISHLEISDHLSKAITGNICANPRWDNGNEFLTDVALTNIPNVHDVSNSPLIVAPSAILQNVGTADVPWFRKFSTPQGQAYPPPYQSDQHPLLIWNMYRHESGMLRQIGRSAVKHAFNTINRFCSCFQGGGSYEPWDENDPAGYYASILWSASHPDNSSQIGCVDEYDAFTNHNPEWLGIRSEVTAHTGEWEQCGSIFSPNSSPSATSCNQAPQIDYQPAPDERRMIIDENELLDPTSEYWVEAWYIVRDDINIFNTMGHVTVIPQQTSFDWNFPTSNFQQGSILDAWVNPTALTPDVSTQTLHNAEGHVGLAAKSISLGNGLTRYYYALANHDYDPAIDEFSLNVPEGLVVENQGFYDVDHDNNNDWQFTNTNNELTWLAPTGNELTWGTLYGFYFDISAAPLPRENTATVMVNSSLSSNDFLFEALIPAQLLFFDGMED